MKEPGRFSHEHLEALRFHVEDEKYPKKGPFLVDLEVKPHGQCDCGEFRIQVSHLKKRTTCAHIDYLIDFLQAVKQRPKAVAKPKFKSL
jgi:hypothetical protein